MKIDIAILYSEHTKDCKNASRFPNHRLLHLLRRAPCLGSPRPRRHLRCHSPQPIPALLPRDTTAKDYVAVELDVRNQHSIAHACDTALEEFSRVDIVVNNTGYVLSGPFEE